jgi:predicted Zn-ribbon and HTH transcriptional regulator
MSRAERNRRKRTEHPLKYAPIKCPNCGLMVDEKYIIGLDSICPICGRELFAELKKIIKNN